MNKYIFSQYIYILRRRAGILRDDNLHKRAQARVMPHSTRSPATAHSSAPPRRLTPPHLRATQLQASLQRASACAESNPAGKRWTKTARPTPMTESENHLR